MDELDTSLIVLNISAGNNDAISALYLPQNEKWLVKPANFGRKIATPRRKREGTPLVECQSVDAVLRIDCLPYNATNGWVFGRDDYGSEDDDGDDDDGDDDDREQDDGQDADGEDEGIDFVLGTFHQGVSKKHFSIDYNWEAKTLLLRNLSTHGTKWTNPETGGRERIHTSMALLSDIHYMISAGTVRLVLQVPSRNERQQAKYNAEFERLRAEACKATPQIHGLAIEHPEEETPMVIGDTSNYKRGRVLGTGATSVVHEVVEHETGYRFAAKEYTFTGQTEAVLKSMMLEIRLLQKLKHEHIIQYVDVFRDPHPNLVMELALMSLAECKVESDGDCVTLLLHVLDGLDFLHGHNIMHRDIKPANILLTKKDPPKWKLSDFGLSKENEVFASTFCGSPSYLAPEVDNLAFSVYSNAVDIWSVGVVGVEYSCGIDLNTRRLLKGMSNRRAWCVAVGERSKASRLAPYLTAMLDMAAPRRPSAGEMRARLQDWRSDELEETALVPPQDEASQSANVGTAPTLGVGMGLGASRKRALPPTD